MNSHATRVGQGAVGGLLVEQQLRANSRRDMGAGHVACSLSRAYRTGTSGEPGGAMDVGAYVRHETPHARICGTACIWNHSRQRPGYIFA
jgi:hypothetical protein